MIEARQVGKDYGKRSVLDGVSLAPQSGQVLAVLGPNGAGKSTLFRILTGELPSDRGEVFWDGRPMREAGLATMARRRAAMNQNYHIPFPISAREVVMMGRAPFYGWKESARDAVVVRAVLNKVEMTEFADRDYPTLSGGEKQRIQLARALAQLEGADGVVEGKTLLLDEPSSALDLKHRHDVLRICADYARKGAAVVIIMHDLNMALSYCDEVLVLDQGQEAVQGPVRECLTEDIVEKVFQIPMKLVRESPADRGFFRSTQEIKS